MNLTKKEKQDKIHNFAIYIASNIFYGKGNYKYADAYDKIKSRVYLDWNISINNRIKNHENKKITMFDVLSEDELDKTIESCNNLLKLYKDVIERKVS